MDVGEVIHESIVRAIEGGTSGGLPHPLLIIALCHQVGVHWDNDEVLQAPLALIDHSVIARYKIWGGGESHPRGLGFIIVPHEPENNLLNNLLSQRFLCHHPVWSKSYVGI